MLWSDICFHGSGTGNGSSPLEDESISAVEIFLCVVFFYFFLLTSVSMETNVGWLKKKVRFLFHPQTMTILFKKAPLLFIRIALQVATHSLKQTGAKIVIIITYFNRQGQLLSEKTWVQSHGYFNSG